MNSCGRVRCRSFAGIETKDRPMCSKAFSFLAILPLIGLSPAPAEAAPQILGLIASNKPVPMTCAHGTCTAELSSVCLQQHRDTPSTGTVYRPAKSTHIVLTVSGADGVVRRQRVEAALDFISLRQFSAVKVSLPEVTVRRLGSGQAKLSVGAMASIIPVAVQGDPNPQSASEIASYTGPLRALAERAFEQDNDRVNATRILNQMVNRLPESGSAGIEELPSLWRRTVSKDVTAGTQKFLKRAVKDCRETLRIGVMSDLRSCLSYHHDYLSGENTTNGWQAMNPGS
jgi:hypothetical protein